MGKILHLHVDQLIGAYFNLLKRVMLVACSRFHRRHRHLQRYLSKRKSSKRQKQCISSTVNAGVYLSSKESSNQRRQSIFGTTSSTTDIGVATRRHSLSFRPQKNCIKQRRQSISGTPYSDIGGETIATEVLKEEVRLLKLNMEMFLRREGELIYLYTYNQGQYIERALVFP